MIIHIHTLVMVCSMLEFVVSNNQKTVEFLSEMCENLKLLDPYNIAKFGKSVIKISAFA